MTAAPVVIACALTGGMTTPGQSAAIPCTPEQIVASGVEAWEAGAALLHVHVREPQSGRPIADIGLFREVIGALRERTDAIVQPTTGGGVGMTLEQRAEVVTGIDVEMASFNVGSFNFGLFGARRRPEMAPWEVDYLESSRDFVFRNTFADVERMAALFADSGTVPEFELYDVGHLHNLAYLLGAGLVKPPVHVQFVLGVLGAAAARADHLLHMLRTARDLFGTDGFTWSVAGVGYPGQFHLGALALMHGGHMRVGLEDNLRLSASERAGSNAQLVRKAVALAELLDRVPATPDQARELLGLRGRDASAAAAAPGAENGR